MCLVAEKSVICLTLDFLYILRGRVDDQFVFFLSTCIMNTCTYFIKQSLCLMEYNSNEKNAFCQYKGKYETIDFLLVLQFRLVTVGALR